MTDWSVHVEVAGGQGSPPVPDSVADALMERLEPHGGVVSSSIVEGRISATFTVTAPVASKAAAQAERLFFAQCSPAGVPAWPVIRLEAVTHEQLAIDLETSNFPELVGVAEVAELAGVTKQRASKIADNAGFPDPMAELAAGPVWAKDAVERFLERWERKPGRPPKAAAEAVTG